ncbi:MAG TPA: HAD family hydrolase [Candidatus Obscuribacterales bacterium]
MGLANALRPVVFLDRDGTLNEEIGYIKEVEKLQLIKGAASAIRKLNEAGVAAILVTNQTGAARGYYGEDHIVQLNKRLQNLLAAENARLDAVYYCPHLAEGTVQPYNRECNCRKPLPGMVESALAENADLDRSRSYVVGDKSTDVELARNCGAKAVLVTTGYGQDVVEGKYQWKVKPDYTAPDIVAAVAWILDDLKSGLR